MRAALDMSISVPLVYQEVFKEPEALQMTEGQQDAGTFRSMLWLASSGTSRRAAAAGPAACILHTWGFEVPVSPGTHMWLRAPNKVTTTPGAAQLRQVNLL